MNNVLMIAYFFPPTAATAAMRPLNFCRHLLGHGWAVRVLATDHVSALPPQSVDQKLIEAIPRNVQVIRVGHANPRGRLLQFRERFRRLLHRDAPVRVESVSESAPPAGIASPGQRKRLSIFQLLATWFLEFPDLQRHWYRPAIRALAELAPHDRPDVIWATGGPWTSLLVGKNLATRWGVPFVADFRDPWIGNSLSTEMFSKRSQVLEHSVCATASRVILNTEELRMAFCARYPEFVHKFVTLTNGYGTDLESFYAELREAGKVAPTSQGASKSIELCHFGTVYGSRSPVTLFQAIEELVLVGTLKPSQLRLRFVGAWDVDDVTCERLAKRLEEREMLRREPPIPHRQCLREMAQADLLLILQQDFPLQIPAKIYEYIVAGRPLLVLGGEGATANLVQRHRLGRCCANNVQEIKRTVMAFLSGQIGLVAPDSADTAQFSYRALSAKLAEILSAVCRERPSASRSSAAATNA